jgi:PAS domain S-box-containing protein
MGKRDSDLLPQNEAIINAEMDKQVIADGKSILNRECFIPGSRKTKWGIMSKIPIFDQEGKIEGLVGFFIDITSRKKLEEKYDRIVNMSPHLISVAGMDGYFKFVNPTWEKTLGYNSEELLAKPFLNFVHPDDHVRNNTEMASLAKGNLCIDFENRYIHKNGEIRYLQWTAAPVPDEKLIYCIAKDVTEHKQTEEALRVHQIELEMQNVEQRRTYEELDSLRQRYFDLYDLAPVGFCTIDQNGLIIEANLTASNLFGVNRSKLVNQPISRFIFPEDQDIYYLKHKKLSVTGKRQDWNMQMLNAKGISFWAYLQATSGKNDEYMIAINDITESKKVEEKLRVHQIELETQNEELRRTHGELEAASKLYFDIYDLAPVGFCTTNEKGLIIEANLTTASLLGMERSKLLKQPISRFILPEDQDIYYLKRKTILTTGKQQAWDMRLVDATGSPFLSYIQGMPGQNENIMLTINKTLCRKQKE